jgi:energy-coupling factor transporter ATP-binding protein EcfA2
MTAEPTICNLRVRDANEIYSISERSLGFRWFFAFPLLTQYRGFRQNATTEVLFLLDEPASNLHPSAQSQLLESFGSLPGDSSVIYTTHSHHMINPAWLEGTYVVKNEGLDYDSNEDDYTAKNTQITLTRYREFASKHPNQTTYFQPILDVLDFKPGRLDNVPNVVMAEGKNDFYTVKYFADRLFKSAKKLNVMPGTGSGSLETVIRLYLGWGRRFVILLDADSEGLKQKSRYRELFGPIIEQSIFTLSDINPAWLGKEMEEVVSKNDRELIQRTVYPAATKYHKTHFNRAVQELYLTDRAIAVSDETKNNFELVFKFCAERLGT